MTAFYPDRLRFSNNEGMVGICSKSGDLTCKCCKEKLSSVKAVIGHFRHNHPDHPAFTELIKARAQYDRERGKSPTRVTRTRRASNKANVEVTATTKTEVNIMRVIRLKDQLPGDKLRQQAEECIETLNFLGSALKPSHALKGAAES